MKTTQDASPTKARLLDAAQDLMLAKGFAATTVDEICEAAELTKGRFFHYFKSKDELGKVLLERFCCDAERLHEAMLGDDRDPLKRVYHYLDEAATHAQRPEGRKGCLLGTFAQELCEAYPDIREVCAQGFSTWAKRFGEELSRAKALYAPKASFDPQGLAEYLIAIMEGSLILSKTRKHPSIVAENLRHFKAYLKMLLKR